MEDMHKALFTETRCESHNLRLAENEWIGAIHGRSSLSQIDRLQYSTGTISASITRPGRLSRRLVPVLAVLYSFKAAYIRGTANMCFLLHNLQHR